MDKQFPIEAFEYEGDAAIEGEAEQLTRDHRSGRVAVVRSPWTAPQARTVVRTRAYAPRRAPIWRRFPHLPFPPGPSWRYPAPYAPLFAPGYDPAGGCSCDAPPPPFDGGAPSGLGDPPAPSSIGDAAGGGAAPAGELGPWRTRADFELDHEDPASSGTPPLARLAVVAKGRHRFTYTFTPEDLVWTARFIIGEAGGVDNLDNAAVIWAMFNRFALFTHARYPTFHAFLRAYSTPLQRVLHSPGAARRHMTDPQFVTTGDRYPGTEIPRGQLRRFLDLQDRPWSQLPAAARALAERALRGEVPNPIGNATELASTAVYYRDQHGKRVPDEATWRAFTERYAASKHWIWIGQVAGLNQRTNAFFLDARAAALPAGAVRVAA